jgi:hypothetical protein
MQESIFFDVKKGKGEIPRRPQRDGDGINEHNQQTPRNPVTPPGRKPRSRQKLSFFPETVDVGLFSKIPGLPQNESNLSDSTGIDTVDAFMAYERYGESCEMFQSNACEDRNLMVDQDQDALSLTSRCTKDTFSTSPAVGTVKRRGGRFIPSSMTRACSWHFKWAEAIVKSRTFKRLSIFLIVLNCAICAVATTDWVTESVRREQQFDTTKDIFVWIMTMELAFQFLAHGPFFFADGWLLFDLIVIGFSWTYNSVLVIRTFRVVRTLRYVTGHGLVVRTSYSEIRCDYPSFVDWRLGSRISSNSRELSFWSSRRCLLSFFC